MNALKNHPRGAKRVVCGGVGVTHTPTYTGSSLAADLFFSGFIKRKNVLEILKVLFQRIMRMEVLGFMEELVYLLKRFR